jgi:hypothetical protein
MAVIARIAEGWNLGDSSYLASASQNVWWRRGNLNLRPRAYEFSAARFAAVCSRSPLTGFGFYTPKIEMSGF